MSMRTAKIWALRLNPSSCIAGLEWNTCMSRENLFHCSEMNSRAFQLGDERTDLTLGLMTWGSISTSKISRDVCRASEMANGNLVSAYRR